jgi:glycine/D-amino acid oxidase-like deaminating enzyme
MANGTAAAMLLSDLILGKENEWSRLYDSTRTSLSPRRASTRKA